MEKDCKNCAHRQVCIFLSVNWHGKAPCEYWGEITDKKEGSTDEKQLTQK